jgi:N-acetylglutamate synthase-like GNAT family acetyltransferase
MCIEGDGAATDKGGQASWDPRATLLRLPPVRENASMQTEQPKAMLMVRVATEDDEAAARLLARRAFDELRRVYKPKHSAVATSSLGIRIVAEIEGQIVGTVRYEAEAQKLHLRGLAVEASHRRTGVGRALVEHCSGIAMSAGLPTLSLYTIKETGNVAFFERLGFRIVRDEPASWAVSALGENDLIEVYMECYIWVPPGSGRGERFSSPCSG